MKLESDVKIDLVLQMQMQLDEESNVLFALPSFLVFRLHDKFSTNIDFLYK